MSGGTMSWRELFSARESASESAQLDIHQFVAREGPALLDYFIRRVESTDDAADLLSDAFVVLWRRRASIPSDMTESRMWLYGVARKVLTTHRRGTGRRKNLSERLRLELAVASNAPHHEEALLYEHVRHLIKDLDEIDREIIGLVYWEGFALVEVAQILSMKPATVRSRHARARAALRMALLENGDEESDESDAGTIRV
ncbi:MAG: RNA polymerase sigma factor [Microbacteriaceae bacterium]